MFVSTILNDPLAIHVNIRPTVARDAVERTVRLVPTIVFVSH